MTVCRRAVGAVLLVLLLLAVAISLYARSTLPQVDGRLELPGLAAPLTLERDSHGIPTVRATTPEGALFGLGFLHAQDRLWQLETHRRIASGRLAEAFGPAALENDKFLRALGAHRAAAAQWARMAPPARAGLLAYTAGINAAIASTTTGRSPEFAILGLEPQAWTPEDSLAWAVMVAWDLGGNWSTELLRMRLALKLPVERIDQLLPPYPGDKPLPLADYAALFRGLGLEAGLGLTALAAAPESGTEGIGSNNWVVSGARSVTGKPLLANDPHLKLGAPALWYVARLEAPGLRVAGGTIPGLPLVLIGQNEQVAWGLTNTGPDVQDLYLERIRPGAPGQYQTPSGWAPFESWEETVKVKGQADVRFTARATRHGPVISDGAGAMGLSGGVAMPAYALALRWTALEADVSSMAAGLALAGARSVAELVAASAGHAAPMQNIVAADRDGHIGFVAAGRVPLRKPENDLKGQVPAPGWEARYDWAGYLDPAATPRELDPARGWIATANQKIHGPDYPHFIGREWAAPYRMQRIGELLEQQPRHSLASLRRIQADQRSLAALKLLPMLRQARSTNRLAADAQARLAAFDGTMAADQAAPLIFWAWTRHVTEGIFADELGSAGSRSGRDFRDALEGVLERDDVSWCDNRATASVETCAQQVDAAFDRALLELEAAHGGDVAQWQWGRAHLARAEHRPFSRVAPLRHLFELRTPVGGDTHTVNAAKVSLRPDAVTGELYLNEHGPSLRALFDIGEPGNSRVMQSSGQSGNVFSPHYRGFAAPWARVEDVLLWRAPAVSVLRLEAAKR